MARAREKARNRVTVPEPGRDESVKKVMTFRPAQLWVRKTSLQIIPILFNKGLAAAITSERRPSQAQPGHSIQCKLSPNP